MDLSGVVWRKSRRSGNGGADCIEIGVLEAPNGLATHKSDEDRLVVMRDSRDPGGPKLFFTESEWQAFRSGIDDGDFDDLIQDTNQLPTV